MTGARRGALLFWLGMPFPVAVAAPVSPPSEQESRPPSTIYEVEIRQREIAIEADRRRGIALLEEFIHHHDGDRAMPEALFRLSALYWERSQERFLSAMHRWADHVEQCKQRPERCPKGPPAEPQLDLTQSQAIYRRMIDQYPGFRKLDTVRYLYGFSLRDQGHVDQAQAQFWAIIRNHPDSTFYPDAWLAVGDHRFYSDNDFKGALEAYTNILNHPGSDAYAMALFKTAWCHWKLGHREQAIVRFKQVLDQAASPEQDEAGRKRLNDLREEALEYLVQVISEDETQSPKDIYDFLASIGGEKYSRKVLVRLGEAYEAQTRYDKSVPAYRFLIELDSTYPDNADYQLHVFTGVRGQAKIAEALGELERLDTKWGPKTPWGARHPQEAANAHARGEELLYDFSRSIHEGAQAHEKDTKNPDRERYGLAARAYEDYVARFPANARAVELSYLAGDIYAFKLGKPEPAGDAYLRVGESAPVGPLHRDALLAAISAYEQVLAQPPLATEAPPAAPAADHTDSGDKAAPGDGDAPKGGQATPKNGASGAESEPAQPTDAASETPEYRPVEAKFIRATDLFAALFPDDEEIDAVVYKLGEFFYGRGDYDAAVRRFGHVVIHHPDGENAAASGDRILESLRRAKDYDNIELWAQKLKSAKAFQAPEEKRRLDRIIVESLLKQGETLADRGYYARSASYYLRVAREHPDDQNAPLALNNAGAALERAERADAATAVYRTLAEKHPATPQGADAALIVARVNENIARYDAAAELYARLVERHPAHKARADALYNAGILYQALGQHEQAISQYEAYARQYSSREDAIDVELRIGQVHAQAGQHRKATAAFAGFEKRHPKDARAVQAATLRGESLIELGDDKQAQQAFSKATQLARSHDGEAKIFGARARFRQGDLVYREFEAAKLDSRPARLGASLERKAKLLASAKDIYLDVLGFSSAEWSTAALYRIGASYERFAKSLREYPVPKKLTADQEQAYMEQLDTYALMFEEQAIESYKSGYQKAMELGIYNRHTKDLRSALGRLSKREFPPIVEIGTDPLVAEGATRGGRPIKGLQR